MKTFVAYLKEAASNDNHQMYYDEVVNAINKDPQINAEAIINRIKEKFPKEFGALTVSGGPKKPSAAVIKKFSGDLPVYEYELKNDLASFKIKCYADLYYYALVRDDASSNRAGTGDIHVKCYGNVVGMKKTESKEDSVEITKNNKIIHEPGHKFLNTLYYENSKGVPCGLMAEIIKSIARNQDKAEKQQGKEEAKDATKVATKFKLSATEADKKVYEKLELFKKDLVESIMEYFEYIQSKYEELKKDVYPKSVEKTSTRGYARTRTEIYRTPEQYAIKLFGAEDFKIATGISPKNKEFQPEGMTTTDRAKYTEYRNEYHKAYNDKDNTAAQKAYEQMLKIGFKYTYDVTSRAQTMAARKKDAAAYAENQVVSAINEVKQRGNILDVSSEHISEVNSLNAYFLCSDGSKEYEVHLLTQIVARGSAYKRPHVRTNVNKLTTRRHFK